MEGYWSQIWIHAYMLCVWCGSCNSSPFFSFSSQSFFFVSIQQHWTVSLHSDLIFQRSIGIRLAIWPLNPWAEFCRQIHVQKESVVAVAYVLISPCIYAWWIWILRYLNNTAWKSEMVLVKLNSDPLRACMTCPLCHKIFEDATTISLCLHTCNLHCLFCSSIASLRFSCLCSTIWFLLLYNLIFVWCLFSFRFSHCSGLPTSAVHYL